MLINNAGTTWGAATVDHPLEAWQKVVDLNLTSMFVVCQEVGRRSMLPRRQGKIINIASILGLVGGGDPGRPATLAYNTTKGGVVNFTRSLAAEWAQYNINVNAIAPGFFPTKMTKGVMEMMGEAVAAKAPLKRVGGPEDLKGLTVLPRPGPPAPPPRAARFRGGRVHHRPDRRGRRRRHRCLKECRVASGRT